MRSKLTDFHRFSACQTARQHVAAVNMFKPSLRWLGVEVWPPAIREQGLQAQWHCTDLMRMVRDDADTSDDAKKRHRRSLNKATKAIKDIHNRIWPGAPVPIMECRSSHSRKDGASRP